MLLNFLSKSEIFESICEVAARVEICKEGVTLIDAIAVKEVTESTSLLCLTSTSNPNFNKKSAPIVGRETFATINVQVNLRRRPRSRARVILPYVSMRELFAAKSLKEDGVVLAFEGGMTETSAPVSIKKDRFVFLSKTKRRR